MKTLQNIYDGASFGKIVKGFSHFTPFSSVSIVDFEQVNVMAVVTLACSVFPLEPRNFIKMLLKYYLLNNNGYSNLTADIITFGYEGIVASNIKQI